MAYQIWGYTIRMWDSNMQELSDQEVAEFTADYKKAADTGHEQGLRDGTIKGGLIGVAAGIGAALLIKGAHK